LMIWAIQRIRRLLGSYLTYIVLARYLENVENKPDALQVIEMPEIPDKCRLTSRCRLYTTQGLTWSRIV
jgi:hypothetical protein